MKIRFQSEKIITIFRPFFLFFCLTGFLFPGGTITYAEVAGPGWFTATAEPVSHEEAMQYLAERAKTQDITRIKPRIKGSAPSDGAIQPKAATTITNPIADLARGLHNDPKLIFDYVHNHIDYVPYFGSLKGATLTLLTGAGNDCDQAALLIALLRQAGYTAQFRYGTMDIPYVDLSNWLGVANNYTLIGNVLSSGGIPVTVYTNTDFARVDRFWVQAVVDGTTYQFDPAWKSYSEQTGIDVGSAMSYNRASLLASATSGATVTSTYARNLNKNGIASRLTTYTTNLVNTIKNQHPNATVQEIVGGREVVQTQLATYPDAMPAFTLSGTISTWNEVPGSHTTTIRIRHHGIDKTYITPDIAGRRLTLTYDAGHKPHLNLDGVSKATGTVVTTDDPQNLEIFIDHPYSADSSHYQDQGASTDSSFCTAGSGHCLAPYKVKRYATYALITAFGGTNDNLLGYRQQKLDQYLAAGLSNTSEKVLGETLNIMGLTWMKECTLSDQLSSAKILRIKHHRMGVMAQEEGYYVDVKVQAQTSLSRQDPNQDVYPSFYGSNFLFSGFEHGMLEQLMGSDKPGASTIKLLKVANSSGMNVYWANSSTYGSIKNSLQNYSPSELAGFQSRVNAGHTLILPRDAHLHVGDWTGKGYMDKYQSGNSGSIGMIIGGNYSGGYAGYQGSTNPPKVNHSTQTNVQSTPTPSNAGQSVSINRTPTSPEPVNMASGSYLSDHTDLALGLNSKMPLGFHRSYTSAANMQKVDKHGFGYGWAHNYDIRLEEGSAGNPVLGLRTPVDAASMVAAQYVILDLLKNEDNIKGWMISSLAAKWAIDRVINNVVTIRLGNKNMQFVKLPNGSFVAPPGITSTLTKSGSTYTLKERFGAKMVFVKVSNKKYRISYQQDADGNRINFAYSGDKLTKVSNTFGHSLTLHYSGTKISSVSDSSNRSVSFGYS
ncbi:MAG TPA: transglutaminase domain-containing protein, partial [Desulfobulbaceae bacterium]|nr:transglutaminase domain-containing protein [Desulfobulbaceae bacterium]